MTTEAISPRAVAITGAAGYVGSVTLAALMRDRRGIETIVAIDVRAVPEARRIPGVTYVEADVRSKAMADIFRSHEVDTVVHLASIVTPGPGSSRELEYQVDVLGTQNVLDACVGAGVRSIVVTSSCAAYGFHADNPEWLRETTPLRGNDEFAYARHKRLVEEMLQDWRGRFPELRQLVLRPGTILGRATKNQITALFEKRVIFGIRGAASPFAFIWDEDVAACILQGIHERKSGIYNLIGDGAMTMRDIAARTGKPYVALPAGLVRGAVAVLRRLGLTRYGPEQVDFVRYRSAPLNDALKTELGFVPRLDSRQVFDLYWESRTGREPLPVLAAAAAPGAAA